MQIERFTKAQADALLPGRKAESNKNDYGRVWAFCGSAGYTGAPYFAAQGGCAHGQHGIVILAVPQEIYPILAVKLNEPVLYPYTLANWQEGAHGGRPCGGLPHWPGAWAFPGISGTDVPGA